MNNKLRILLLTTFLVLVSLAVFNTVSAAQPPPPCLTTDLCFKNAKRVSKFTPATDLAVGYINGDSNLDFATTSWPQDKILFRTGNGNGGFLSTWIWSMGDGTHEVDLADFNGDGLTDIIANNSDQDRVFIRWGHANWAGASVWATGDYPHYIATGDLNNDGLDDFATGNTMINNETITVRLRQAGGGFAAGTNYPVNSDLGDVAFNDCDHDGDLDLFYSAVDDDHPYEEEGHVYFRRNDFASGSFMNEIPINMDSLGSDSSIGSIAFGDFNEDSWDDLIATRIDDKLVRVLGGPNCSFHDPIVADVDGNPYQLAIADMNGDGHLDIVLSHYINPLKITIYLGDGNGNVSLPYEPDLDPLPDLKDIDVGDFNNDGLLDIIYADSSAGVWLLLAYPDPGP